MEKEEIERCIQLQVAGFEAKLRMKYAVLLRNLEGAPKPKRKTEIENYIHQNRDDLEPEHIEFLEGGKEAGTKEALEFLGATLVHGDHNENISKSKLKELAAEGIIKNGPKHSPRAKHTYCRISLVELIRVGEDALRDAQASKI